MEPFYNSTAGKTMLNENQRQLISSFIILAIPFAAFAILFYLLSSKDSTWENHWQIAITYLLFLMLYVVVLLIFTQHTRLLKKNIIHLQNELTEEKGILRKLQGEFEENIEKRTFELQRANGALNREIAERIQAEEEVRDLQKQLHLILDCAGEGILGLDNKGRVIFMNQAASLMLGWEVDELLGKTHHALIHHTRTDGTPHHVEDCPIYKAYQDGIVHYRTGDVFWCKNGTSFPVEYASTPIRDSGMLTGAVVVFRDMSTFM